MMTDDWLIDLLLIALVCVTIVQNMRLQDTVRELLRERDEGMRHL